MDFVSKGMKNFQYRLSKIEILSLEKLGKKQRHTHFNQTYSHTFVCCASSTWPRDSDTTIIGSVAVAAWIVMIVAAVQWKKGV